MNANTLQAGALLAIFLALPLGAMAQQGEHAGHGAAASSGGHAGHAGHAGHDMGPQVSGGAWSYLDRDNPEPHTAGRWEMLPMPGVVAGYEFVRNVDEATVCASLDNPRIMVDRATREACQNRPSAMPFRGVAAAVASEHGDHGGHAGMAGQMDHGAHAAMAGQMDHGAHAEMAGQMDHGAHAAMAGQVDHGAHAAMAGQMDHGAHAAMAGQMDHSAHAAMAGQMDHGAHGAAASAPAPEHAWMAPPEAVATANPVKADKASVRRGETVYRANCMTCHGAQGLGDGPLAASLPTRPANLVAHLAHHTDGDYAWKIRTGRGAMPAFAGVLKDQQVWDAVNYLRSLGAAQQDSGGHAHHGH